MKKLHLFLALILGSIATLHAQSIGIGTNDPDPSAALEISSVDQGILVPRMTSALRAAIANPANGLLVFDTNTNSFWFKGNVWTELIDSSNTVIHKTGNNIYMGMNGKVGIGTSTPISKLDVVTPLDSNGIMHRAGPVRLKTKLKAQQALIGTETDHDLGILVNDDEKMRITKTGKVGIGTTTPGSKFEVVTPVDSNGIMHKAGLVSLFTKIREQKALIGTKSDHALGILVNDDEKMHFTKTGKVGIGTTTPGSKFEVVTPVDSNGIMHKAGPVRLKTKLKAQQALIGTETDHDLGILVNDDEKMRITITGKVGIGTTTPGSKFEVVTPVDSNGIMHKAGLVSLFTKIREQKALIGTKSDHALGILVNDDEKMHFTKTGKVGIGTTTPGSKFEVVTPVDSNGIMHRAGLVRLKTKLQAQKALIGTESDHDLGIIVNDQEKMHITKDGKVGIGTTTPTSKLEMDTDIEDAVKIKRGDRELKIKMKELHAEIGTTSNHPLHLNANNGINHLTISTAGNIGIGIGTPNAPLQFINSVASRKIVLWENGNNDHQYFGFGINPAMLRYQAQGAHAFFNGVDATTSTELMRITAQGRVGIGIVSPLTSLDIARGTGSEGTLLIRGTTHYSHFSFGTDEHTFIRGGKAGSHVILNELAGQGNVGVGTNSPVQKLHVAGKAYVRDSLGIGISSPNAPLQFSNGIQNRKLVLFDGFNNDHQFYGFGINLATMRYQVAGTDKAHVFYAATSTTTSNELMRIGGNGNIGIGTPSPDQILSVANKFGVDVNGTIHSKNDVTRMMYMFQGVTSVNKMILAHSPLFANWGLQYNAATNHFNFLADSAAVMTVDLQSARVGIGTSSPTAALDVVGNANVTGNLSIGYGNFSTQFGILGGIQGTGTCDCPPGTTVLSGGFVSPNLDVIASVPAPNGTGWTVTANNLLPFTVSVLTVYAVCARIAN